MVFKETLYELEQDVKVNSEKPNNIRYADDTVIFASMEGLQQQLDRTSKVRETYGLKLNVKN